MGKYMVFDLETENHTTFRRFCNPFDPVNWVVARGWKKQGDKQCSWTYHPKPDGSSLDIPDDVTLLVGHNIKFDLMFEWGTPQMKAFFKRGGRIWDTQYVEYLLEAMQQEYHMNSMDQIVEKYDGRLKINAVKELWEQGYLTSEIDRDLLIDYLVGTEDEQRNSGDIGNTERIFLGQIKRAKEKNMLTMIAARMDGLCCTTEMEYNGLKIDVQEAKRRMLILEQDLKDCNKELEQYIPELPEGLEFNWNSGVHVSALIFGGTMKYSVKAPYKDDTGEWARKLEKQQWPLFNGVPVSPDDAMHLDNQDMFTSGKRKGEYKFRAVEVPGELKQKLQTFFFSLPGYTAPMPKWETALKDAAGNPVYQTGADIIAELGNRDIPFLKTLSRRAELVKELGTYYVQYDPGKKSYVGMLTCVDNRDHIIHHNLNHTTTVTSRLSGSNPNAQNIPRDDKSEVKKMFRSRFESGKMLEADYSQLEVVVQGLLSMDENLCADIRNKVDFHCKRVAYKHGITYEEAVARCKDEHHPEHKFWKSERTKAKVFSFQRAYGAGAALIAESTGMTIDEVKKLIEAEEEMYPGVMVFNKLVEDAIYESAVPFKHVFPHGGFKVYRRGYWQAPTGTLYSWRSYDATKYQQREGKTDTFKPTEIKNYPVQGTGGEIVQIILGKLWRHFVAHDNYNNMALLCNTVHDCVWIDVHTDVLDAVAKDTKRIMESVPEVLTDLYGMDVPVPFPVEIEVGDNLYTKQVVHI